MVGEWPNVVISHVATPVIGGTPSRSVAEHWGGDIPWATAKDVAAVSGRYLEHVEEYISEEGLKNSAAKLLPKGTIVITARGTVGALAQLGRAMAFNQTCYALLPTDALDNDFLFYALKGTLAEMRALTYGTVFETITTQTFDHWLIPLPPLPEQRAIAHILGTLDDKIELNRRMSETLEAMARALFKAWFVDFEPVRAKMEGRWQRGQSLPGLPAHLYDLFPDRLVDSELGEIPEGWRVGRLGELSEKPQYGYTASAKEEPVGPKFLRITDINKLAWIDWPTVPYCEIEQEDFEQYRLHPGDVLIARMADPGHGVVIEEQVEAVFASYLIRFRLKDQAYIRYIQYWLRSDGYWELVTSRYAGTTRASLNAQVLSSFQLIIPPKPIASAFSEIVNALRNKVVAAAGESRTLAALRDALLPKLIRGEIRLKDAEQFLKERGLC
jgi:type I restriction enzyme S subunit